MVQTLSHTLGIREVPATMNHREFIYVGEPIPELNERERCLLEIEKRYSLNQKKQRQA